MSAAPVAPFATWTRATCPSTANTADATSPTKSFNISDSGSNSLYRQDVPGLAFGFPMEGFDLLVRASGVHANSRLHLDCDFLDGTLASILVHRAISMAVRMRGAAGQSHAYKVNQQDS